MKTIVSLFILLMLCCVYVQYEGQQFVAELISQFYWE